MQTPYISFGLDVIVSLSDKKPAQHVALERLFHLLCSRVMTWNTNVVRNSPWIMILFIFGLETKVEKVRDHD